MKSKIFNLVILATILVLSSCEDFLEEKNKTGKTEDLVFVTEEAIDGLVAACYSYNRLWYGKEAGAALSEAGTDLWWAGGDSHQRDLVTYGNLTPASSTDPANNNACLDEYWEAFYAAINICNVALKNVETTDQISEEKRQQYLSEVKFLRAFYYWHMVELWGPVTLNLEPTSSVDLEPTRNSVDDIYAQMFEDVDFAINNLSPSEAPNSRVTHWAAKAFKARLCLYYASAYYGNTSYYATAAQEARDVINGCGKTLYDDYENVWLIENSSTLTNDEFIWAIDYYDVIGDAQSYNFLPPRLTTDEDGDPENWVSVIARRTPANANGHGNVMHLMYTGIWNLLSDDAGGPAVTDVLNRWTGEQSYFTKESPDSAVLVDVENFYVKYGIGYRRFAPSRYALQDVWDETIDERFDGTFRTAWYKHPDVVPQYWGSDSCAYPDMQDTVVWISNRPLTQAQRDWASTRYKIEDVVDMFGDDDEPDLTIATSLNPGEFYPMMRKFENTDSPLTGASTNFQDYFSYRDFPVFRISEMYIIAAEALMSTDPATAVEMINTLRTKRAYAGSEAEMQITEADLDIDFILEERAREFTGENMRWFDLKRTLKLEQQIQYCWDARDNFDPDVHYLRPIPATHMDAIVNVTEGPDPNGFWQNPGY
jgi:hypothetical protein